MCLVLSNHHKLVSLSTCMLEHQNHAQICTVTIHSQSQQNVICDLPRFNDNFHPTINPTCSPFALELAKFSNTCNANQYNMEEWSLNPKNIEGISLSPYVSYPWEQNQIKILYLSRLTHTKRLDDWDPRCFSKDLTAKCVLFLAVDMQFLRVDSDYDTGYNK